METSHKRATKKKKVPVNKLPSSMKAFNQAFHKDLRAVEKEYALLLSVRDHIESLTPDGYRVPDPFQSPGHDLIDEFCQKIENRMMEIYKDTLSLQTALGKITI